MVANELAMSSYFLNPGERISFSEFVASYAFRFTESSRSLSRCKRGFLFRFTESSLRFDIPESTLHFVPLQSSRSLSRCKRDFDLPSPLLPFTPFRFAELRRYTPCLLFNSLQLLSSIIRTKSRIICKNY
jgi:hypothetical protein